MSKFESKSVHVSQKPSELSEFLSDARNLHGLLPEDRIEDWKAEEDHCSFKVKGLSSMDLQRKSSPTVDKIEYQGGEKAPFPFTLSFLIEESEGESECQVICEADMNMFMERMAQDPLLRLCDHMAEQIKEQAPGT